MNKYVKSLYDGRCAKDVATDADAEIETLRAENAELKRQNHTAILALDWISAMAFDAPELRKRAKMALRNLGYLEVVKR